MHKYSHLTMEQTAHLFSNLKSDASISVTHIRYRNKDEIRSTVVMSIAELLSLVKASMEEGHLPAGDLEVYIPELNQTLVGHHDGIFWLESIS